ncbi:hypothetical protein [Nonomuraea sp. NPDC049709]|uniref:hypothetical protein n=1 Tax=Nonomuraea sp. NPDC049709 TaxID=3154736 RepID=UPI003416EBD1
MFFEPPPPQEEVIRPQVGLPDWFAPPGDEMGVAVATGLTLARGPNVVVALPLIRAYRNGCVLDVEVVLRQRSLSADDFWNLHVSLYPTAAIRTLGGGGLPDRLLRFGVRYADGTTVTTIGENAPLPDRPAGPRLQWQPSGMMLRGGADLGANTLGLWLWPLPPAEPFEFAVEWPVGGIELSITRLDGAAIGSAAGRAVPYWPDPEPGQ